MSWTDDLRKVPMADGRIMIGASFRGVPFYVESSDRSGGRRLVNHEFIGRDDNFVEDLGRKTRTFTLEGYVIGDDYVAQRDKLLAAVEADGPGQLVHPYYGLLRGFCEVNGVRESPSEGRMARFALTFIESPLQPPAPTAVDNLADKVSDATDAANTATDAELAEQYVANLVSFAFDSAETALLNATATLKAKLAPVITATQELAQFNSDLTILTAEAASLVRTPDVVMTKFRESFDALTDTIAAAPGDVMNALLDTFYDANFGAPVVATTATRTSELANQIALQNALKNALVCEAARLAPLVAYVSIEAAMAARDRIADALDAQAALAGDTAYPALVELRAQVMNAVPGDQQLASVVTVTRSMPVPSIVLAYQLYGSTALEQDIVDRNDIEHPGFVAGDLKVLSDG